MAPGVICALRGPGQAQALFPQLAGSLPLLDVFIFPPLRDYLNGKLRFSAKGKHPNLG